MLRNETVGMFQVHSSFDVLVETSRAFRRMNDRADGRVSRELFDLLERNLDEVPGDFSGDVDFDGGDPDDRHVHAAALATSAHILLTQNTQDFGDPDLLPYELYTPDQFFCLVDDGAPDAVGEVCRKQVDYWNARKRAGKPVKPLAVALQAAGCSSFARRVKKHLITLSGTRRA